MGPRAAQQEEAYGRGLARACAGALIFGLPLLMTMEMWEAGFHMGRLRLALFVLVTAAVVLGLARFEGFRAGTTLAEDGRDALAALLVGFVVSALLLGVLGILGPHVALREAVGMVAVQAAPASIGAVLANKQLQAGGGKATKPDAASYPGELFLMAAGALFLAFNVAPTEEMILIGFKMSAWHAVALILISLLALHALVFTVGFAGQHEHEGHLRAFLHFTLAGYGLALTISLYVLWTFGRLDAGLSDAVRSVVVLGFPAALGAALARLVV
jgi:putative integral membrane protein (TIGR02587 family)